MNWQAFMRGAGSVFGVVTDPAVEQALNRSDAEAIASDWKQVGKDLWSAIEQYDATAQEVRGFCGWCGKRLGTCKCWDARNLIARRTPK